MMRSCGAAIAIVFVPGITSGFAGPIERTAESSACKGIVARLLEATDESFDHYSPSGEYVFFRNRKSVLSCTGDRHAGISFTWDTGGFPPNEWFGLVAKAGLIDLTDDDRAVIFGALIECAARLRSEENEQLLLLWRRRGRRAFEAATAE